MKSHERIRSDRSTASALSGCTGRTLAYVRVSGAEQGRHGTSLEGQCQEIESYCKARGLPSPIVRVEVESAAAEKLERREELHALIADASPGDLVLVSKLDRWSRDLVFGVGSIRKLVARGVGWVSIGESIDATSPHDASRLGYMAIGAEEEHKRIRERTVGRRAALKGQGLYVEGPAPFGTRRGPREKRQHLTLVRVEEEAKLVLQVFERCARGSSLSELQTWIESASGRRWFRDGIADMLANRVYIGQVRGSRDEWIDSDHVPQIVSRELFDRARAALVERRLGGGPKPRDDARTASWLLRSLGRCPRCGSKMSSAYRSGGESYVGYYVCMGRIRRVGQRNCDLPYVRVDATDERANDLALARLRELRKEFARSRKASDDEPRKAKGYTSLLGKNAAARVRVVDLAARGIITEADLRTELGRLDAERGELERQRAADERKASGQRPEARAAALARVSELEAAWDRSPAGVRREIISIIARRILIGPEGPRFEWRSAAELAADTERHGKT
jgi:DNA invertase Pin-like site-specific DNA recombinase